MMLVLLAIASYTAVVKAITIYIDGYLYMQL